MLIIFFILTLICIAMAMHGILSEQGNASMLWLFGSIAFAIMTTGV